MVLLQFVIQKQISLTKEVTKDTGISSVLSSDPGTSPFGDSETVVSLKK